MNIKTLKKLNKVPFFKLTPLLREAFNGDTKAISRIRSKVYLHNKDLTVEERIKIETTMEGFGVSFDDQAPKLKKDGKAYD